MYILGLNAFHGDSSAAIFKDGKLIAAIEEERLRRIKHWAGFPSEAIKFCLDECNITIAEVDHITISKNPKINFLKKLIFILKNQTSIFSIFSRFKNLNKINSLKAHLSLACSVNEELITAKIHNIEHHRTHLASAFFASPFNESAVLSVDGFGDFSSTMVGVGKGCSIEVFDSVNYPHSLGIFYTAFTQFLGFPYYGDEYKVMGLAPYGKPSMIEKVRDVVILKDNGLFELNKEYFIHHKDGVAMTWEGGSPDIGPIFSSYMIEKFGDPRKGSDDDVTQYHMDLASSVQAVAEEVIFHLLNHLHLKTGQKNICIAGGCAQNSVANGKILEATGFESLYVPPAGHDAGTAIGGPLWLYHHELKHERGSSMQHGYFGSHFTDDYIIDYLDRHGIEYEKLDDNNLNIRVVDCLLDGGVIGWFQGRAEFGPRALGNRSIIADPTRDDAKELLNLKIKRREKFRPFAPSILEEHVNDYFELDQNAPFMERVLQIKESKRDLLAAVTHVDGSGRLQTVSKKNNEKYYNLISAFYKKKGVPILLNTSFNENEPIVNSPEEAYACFSRTKMDMVVMGNIVVKK